MRGRRSRRRRSRRSIRFTDLLLTLLLLGGIALLVDRFQRLNNQTLTGSVIVHDGDTLTLSGERIRLEGIDAPEFNQRCTRNGSAYPCGREAMRTLRQLVAGGKVVCEGYERDRYDRLLARCMVDGRDVGRELVEAGWALAYGDYDAVEAEARRARRGIWDGGFVAPRDWRAEHDGAASPHDGELLKRLWERVSQWFKGEG
ncbi:thermonuclease family protein [uncultured Nitratireductor sp.]|uniref:thermonuclease family protein n=1 Tax=uncultured Nitratireductor sp. TaxID=520953 RepID=UPI0025F29BDB|nr:thermonuclease family protein [uncultured Nitratireductor sp.]